MVRIVTGEEFHLTAIESQLSQSGVAAQVGLAVGKLNAELDRGYVFALIPSPPNESGSPPCALVEGGADKKKPSKGKPPKDAVSSLVIDVDWVAEHARQVSKMLLGGIHVVGIYVWVGESSFKASSIVLWQTIKAVAAASPFHEECNPIERILIHISYSPRRLPLSDKDASKQNILKDTIYKGITRHAKVLKDARALIDGNLAHDDQTCSSDGVHEVELLLPFMNGTLTEACSGNEIDGLLVFSGAVYASTYLSPKETIAQAVSDIKADIITSLISRLDIISDEAEQMMHVNPNDSSNIADDNSNAKPVHPLLSSDMRKPFSFSFPRRVLLPWLDGIFICDYVQSLEKFEDVKERCKELMFVDVPDTKFLEPETIATASGAKSFWDVGLCSSRSMPSQSKADSKLQSAEGSNSTISKFLPWNILTAGFFLVLSIIVGVWMLFLSHNHKSLSI